MNSAKQAWCQDAQLKHQGDRTLASLWPLLDLPQLLRDLLSLGPTGSPPSFPGRPSDLKLKSANTQIFLVNLGNEIVLNICIGLSCHLALYRHWLIK